MFCAGTPQDAKQILALRACPTQGGKACRWLFLEQWYWVHGGNYLKAIMQFQFFEWPVPRLLEVGVLVYPQQKLIEASDPHVLLTTT